MKNKKVYIFNKSSRAAAYGIGTYIDQYIKCFKKSDLEFGVINLCGKGREVEIKRHEDGYQQISIPAPNKLNLPGAYQSYIKNVVYLLSDIIGVEDGTKYIFHLNFMNDIYLASSLKEMFNCKIVLTAHYANWSFALEGDSEKLDSIMVRELSDLDEKELSVLRSMKNDERMINHCDHFICVAKHNLEIFQKYLNVGRTSCSIISNAIEDEYKDVSENEKTSIRTKYFINSKTKVILFAGRLEDAKGIGFIIESFKETLRKYPDTHLFIAGDGNFSKWLKAAGTCWSKISFVGRVDKKQLYELYKIADVGIVASLHEAFGLVAVEMMMHQLPIIVSETGGLSEIVENNISGIKIPIVPLEDKRVLDVAMLTNMIGLLIDSPTFAKQLGINGRKRFLEKYGLSMFRDKMLDIYRKL